MNDDLASFAALPLGALGNLVPFCGNSDPFGIAKFFAEVYRGSANIFSGYVQGYNPQTHSASVCVYGLQSSSIWSCVFADELISYSFGFSETHPPREGEKVLVWGKDNTSQFGIIIGRIPYDLCYAGPGGDRWDDPEGYHRQLYTQNDKTGDRKIPSYAGPLANKNDDSTHVATHFRPTDVYPGEFAKINQHNCGIKGGMFSVTLLGGAASLRLSALTNSARLTCVDYMRYSILGNTMEFHNGRYLSSERNTAIYQEERLGGSAEEEKVWEGNAEKPKGGEKQTLRPRIKELSGFFGHLLSKFCLRPDPRSSAIRVQDGKDHVVEEGVSRETIDPSGQYRLSAAGMLVFERTGRIPVPVRKAFSTDKDHDLEDKPKALTPFKHNDADECYRQLELFDRQAYDLKNQYSRVDGLGIDDASKKDYTVPQEEEMEPLSDVYDEKFTKSETVTLNKYDKRRAGVYIGEDGSVIMRDAWGSEIVMLGGNVTIACAGNINILPGKTQLTIAGDDIVQKAQNSVDIHASEHDVRLSAARNMEILGGSEDANYSGGVIIESRGDEKKPLAPWDGEGNGEAARTSGIVLKSKNQGVVVDGKEIYVRSSQKTRIVSGNKEVDGEVAIGSKTLKVRSDSILATTDNTAITMSGGSVGLLGKSIGLYADSSMNITKGNKGLVPLTWNDIGNNPASEILPKQVERTEDLKKEETASGKFNRESLEKMMFGFRTSEECGTDKAWSLDSKIDHFRMYEPAWIQVLNFYETLKGVKTKEYKEGANWSNGKPFPGKEAEGSAKYITLKDLKPRNLTSGGFNASRDEVDDNSIIDDTKMMSQYLVRE